MGCHVDLIQTIDFGNLDVRYWHFSVSQPNGHRSWAVFCVMACYSLFRSPTLTQFVIITDEPETRMNPGDDLLNAQEAN